MLYVRRSPIPFHVNRTLPLLQSVHWPIPLSAPTPSGLPTPSLTWLLALLLSPRGPFFAFRGRLRSAPNLVGSNAAPVQ
jgi:hypothetical protein